MGAKLQRIGGIRHIHVVVVLVNDPAVFEAGVANGAKQLCIQQSAGNSTRPERDIVERVRGEGALDQDVSYLQAPARLEDAPPLA